MLNGFTVEYNGCLMSEQCGFKEAGEPRTQVLENGSTRNNSVFRSDSGDMDVQNIIVTYPGLGIVDKWVEIKNTSKDEIKVTRVDSMNGILPAGKYSLKYFTSDWGKEFTPVDTALEGTRVLEVTAGRSSLGMHPWFSLSEEQGSILTCSIAWSGNWIARFEPLPGGKYRVTGGLSNWNFSKILKPGEAMEGVHVIYVFLPKGDLNDTSIEFGRWGRKYWYPKNSLSNSMPVEWNHWWPYDDKLINEDVFKANVDKCVELGVDVCTLDAGWFGPSEEKSEWYQVRGDWHKVNTKRFPSGIRALSDYTHAKGKKFGIWCEIEALGEEAEQSSINPGLVARRDGKHLGYVCLGNPEARKWAFSVLEILIRDYKADWIKLDFNLNPGAGCNRTDHGHGEGDGLYEHYMGYYKLLDTVREKYPEALLENCSSGGLRIDLGMLKHLYMTFLSDPDYSVHAFQLFWGATTMLHPSACLHWSWSQTYGDFHFYPGAEQMPVKEDMPRYVFDYYIRNAMLKNPGYSYRLPELPQWCLERLEYHTRFYKNNVSRFIKEADMYRLTGQALRTGGGDRWNAFQYVTEDMNDAVLFVFRLAGSDKERVLKLRGLEPDFVYTVKYEDGKQRFEKSGMELMETGLAFSCMEEESSEIILISRE